jgi:nuclear transport factor 2 (NTF2) superfamily protein
LGGVVPLEARVQTSDRLRSLREAWVSLEPGAVSSAYLADGTHRGPGVARLTPEQQGATLRGRREIRALVEKIAPLLGGLTYRVSRVLASDTVSVVEYEYESVAGATGLATDIVEWHDDRVRVCRSYGLQPNA